MLPQLGHVLGGQNVRVSKNGGEHEGWTFQLKRDAKKRETVHIMTCLRGLDFGTRVQRSNHTVKVYYFAHLALLILSMQPETYGKLKSYNNRSAMSKSRLWYQRSTSVTGSHLDEVTPRYDIQQ